MKLRPKSIMIVFLVILFPGLATAQQPTPTPPPETDAVAAHINQLISTEDCSIPCFWGLEIGVSDRQMAVDHLGQYFDLEFYEYSEQGLESVGALVVTDWSPTLGGTETNSSGFAMIFRETDQILVAFGLRFDTPEDSYVDWQPYLPQGLFNVYGAPDQILLHKPGYYDLSSPIIYVYADLGLYISYEVYIPGNNAEQTTFCNTIRHMAYIDLQIEDPNLDNELELRPHNLRNLDGLRNIEAVTPYDVATFAELFSRDGICITAQVGYDD